MSTFSTRQCFDDQVCYLVKRVQPRPGAHKVRRSPLEAGPLQIKNVLSARPGNRRESFPGNRRHPAAVRGV
jgi:hypothetical protein